MSPSRNRKSRRWCGRTWIGRPSGSTRPGQRWAWGRDEANRFWVAFGPHTAVSLEADEVPYWLNVYCDLHSLNFERWLHEVLDRFELTRETGPAGVSASAPATVRVH